MSIDGMLTILMYALAPFKWLLIMGLIVIIALHLLTYLRGYKITHHRSRLTNLLALLIGLTNTLGSLAHSLDAWLCSNSI